MRTGGRVDLGECFGEVVGYGFGGGQYLPSGSRRERLYENARPGRAVGALSGGEFLDAESGTHARGFLDAELLVADGAAAIIPI